MTGSLRLHDAGQQLDLVTESVKDSRPSVPTGFAGIDLLLRRGGMLPGTFALLGGRTGTRKSTIIANMMVSMAEANIPVALVGLDEQPWQYAVSLMSVVSGRSRDWVEEVWFEPAGMELRAAWKRDYRNRLWLFTGVRPTIDHIQSLVEMAATGDGEPPAIVFIDYLAKMARGQEYGWNDNQRIPRMAEELAIWSTDKGVSVVALHQLNRTDEYGNVNNKNAGHVPVTLTQLAYGGEAEADIVFGSYRPAMDPIGNMSMDAAKTALGKDFNEDEWYERVAMVRKYRDSTFLQLLKNRPGTHREERGVELVSPYADSLRMEEKNAQSDSPREVRPSSAVEDGRDRRDGPSDSSTERDEELVQ